jgi:hypothetical protein
MTKKTSKTTPAAKKPAATKKKSVSSSEAAKQPCASARTATTLAKHFLIRDSVKPECMPAWQAHGRWLANKEGVRFGPR